MQSRPPALGQASGPVPSRTPRLDQPLTVSADELLTVIADGADLAALHADGSAVLHVTLSAEMFEALCVHGAGDEAVNAAGTTAPPHQAHARTIAAPDWSEEFLAEAPRGTLDITRISRYTPRQISKDSATVAQPHPAPFSAAE